MQLFNGLNMGILSSYKVNNEENLVENPSTETYENSKNEQLNKIKKEISELTDKLENGTTNTLNDKIEIQGILTTEFVNYLKSNKDVAIALNNAVNEVGYDNLDEDNKRAVNNLKKFLEPIVNKSFSDTYNISELNTMQQPKNDEKGDFANGVDKAPDGSESEVKKLLTIIDTKFSTYESILKDENNKDINTTLEKLKMVLNNPVEENVKILQKVIYDNLDVENKNKFLQENRNKKNYNENDKFDGKFGKYMVGWTQKGLGIIEDNLKKLKDAQDVISESEKNNLLGKIKPDIVADANSDPKNWFNNLPEGTEVKFKDDDEKQKLNTVSDSTEIKLIVTTNGVSEEIVVKVKVGEKVSVNPAENPELSTTPLDTTPYVDDGKKYLLMQNSPSLASSTGLTGATFYSMEAFTGNQPGEGKQWELANVPANGDYECYMKLNNKSNEIFKIKVDKDGNLCPVLEKVGETGGILLKNNDSCKKYLTNKLPDSIKDNCVIGWDGQKQDYNISSYEKSLTIEPMTIAGDWVVDKKNNPNHLSQSLAFLNLTNFLTGANRNDVVKLKGWDPDLKIDGNNLKVRVERSSNDGKKWTEIPLSQFGLDGVDVDTLTRFKKYNNHEDWEDNRDRKKPNRNYTKVDGLVGEHSETNPLVQNAPKGQNVSASALASASAATTKEATATIDEAAATTDQAAATTDKTKDAQPAASVATETLTESDKKEIPNELRKMDDNDFNAMKNSLSDNMFIEKSGDNKITYNLQKVKYYLVGLKNDKWSTFRDKLGGKPEGRAWISAIQILLNEKYSNDKLEIDGKLGPKTKEKVINFQKEMNIPNDGLPGGNTIKKLLGDFRGETPAATTQNTDIFPDLTDLSDGDKAELKGILSNPLGLGKFLNGKFVFDEGLEKTDNTNKKYIEITVNNRNIKINEWQENINGLGYKSGFENKLGYLYMGEFKNGKMEGQCTYIWADGYKYEGECKNNKMEGHGTYTYANGDKYEGEYKGGKMTSGKFTLLGKEYQVVRDNNNLMRIGGSDNDGKFIDQNASNGPEIVDGLASS